MTIKNQNQQIRCKYCRFAKEDKSMSDEFWTAYECGNFESPYYKSLLNVDPQGNKLGKITWSGCFFGERSLMQ
jgi:hypothetical protein